MDLTTENNLRFFLKNPTSTNVAFVMTYPSPQSPKRFIKVGLLAKKHGVWFVLPMAWAFPDTLKPFFDVKVPV